MSNSGSTPQTIEASNDEKTAELALATEMEANDDKLPKVEMDANGECRVNVSHVQSYSEMFGNTKSSAFANAMMKTCVNVSGAKEGLEGDKSDALAIVSEIAPRDSLEALLVTQMAAVHITAMRESRLLAAATTIAQLEAHERAFNKLMRTFAAQMETLRKHRHGGKQTVTVQHVNVGEGGQAIVGHVENRGQGRHEK